MKDGKEKGGGGGGGGEKMGRTPSRFCFPAEPRRAPAVPTGPLPADLGVPAPCVGAQRRFCLRRVFFSALTPGAARAPRSRVLRRQRLGNGGPAPPPHSCIPIPVPRVRSRIRSQSSISIPLLYSDSTSSQSHSSIPIPLQHPGPASVSRSHARIPFLFQHHNLTCASHSPSSIPIPFMHPSPAPASRSYIPVPVVLLCSSGSCIPKQMGAAIPGQEKKKGIEICGQCW